MNKKQKKMLTRILIAAVMMVVLELLPTTGILRFVLYMIPYLVIGYDILRKAFRGILNRRIFDENFLMVVATLGAIAVGLAGTGDYTEAIAVMLFYQIGELFQSYAVGKSRKNISELMDIRPDYANVEQEGELVRVDPDEVAVGTEIIVRIFDTEHKRADRGEPAAGDRGGRGDHQRMYQYDPCSACEDYERIW